MMKHDFKKEDDEKIVAAIQDAEKKTSGEIRVHLIKKVTSSIYEEAVQVFEKLGMTRTEARNGILICLCIKDHEFAVIGDSGIHQKVPSSFWDQVRDKMQNHFQKKEFVEGLIQGIHECGEQLAQHFPYSSEDKNELPNQITSH